VKKPIEITLTNIHLGDKRRVVTLGMDGKDSANDFLKELIHNDRRKFDFLKKRIKTVSNYLEYENKLTFNHVGDNVYEFKRPGLRLYAFYDEIDGLGLLIICTNGGTKSKSQQRDIQNAKVLKKAYLNAKNLSDTIFNLDIPKI
jgi:putative component of toxin-antitoxin plasmid stabilization module